MEKLVFSMVLAVFGALAPLVKLAYNEGSFKSDSY